MIFSGKKIRPTGNKNSVTSLGHAYELMTGCLKAAIHVHAKLTSMLDQVTVSINSPCLQKIFSGILPADSVSYSILMTHKTLN